MYHTFADTNIFYTILNYTQTHKNNYISFFMIYVSIIFLCLNALHDRAFDQGYITISTDYQIIVSDVLKRKNNLDDTTRDWICSFDKKQITLPHRTLPDSKFLQYHNDVIFKR